MKKYFIKPTAKLFNTENELSRSGNLLGVDVNYYNSRCENASIFIKNFTLAILINKDADLSFVQNLDESMSSSIDKLKELEAEIKKYNTDYTKNTPLEGIYATVKNTVEQFEKQSNGINREELRKVGYANILDKIEGLIELVRETAKGLASSVNSVNKEYQELVDKINKIVDKINGFINHCRDIADKFKQALYVFDTKDHDKKSLFDCFNSDKLLTPVGSAKYFNIDLNYDDSLGQECDFTGYFKNIFSEREIVYDDAKNIVLSTTKKFRYQQANQEIVDKEIDCKLWLVPVSTFILLRAFVRVNQERKKDHVSDDSIKSAIDGANSKYKEHVKKNKDLYLKKILIDPANDQVTLDRDTVQALKVNEMELLWPKSPGGKLITSLTLKELIMMHFRDVRKHDTFGNIIGFKGTRYESKVKEFIRDNEYLSLARVQLDEKKDKSVEGLMDRINGFTGSKNSRLVRKISIFISSYITEKFQFSLYDNVKTGSVYKDYNETELLSNILAANQSMAKEKELVVEKIKANKAIVKDMENQLKSLASNIRKIDDILNDKQVAIDSIHDEAVSVSLDAEGINSIVTPQYNLELESNSHVRIRVEQKQLNSKAVRYDIAKVLNSIIFPAKISVMDKTMSENNLPKIFLDPLVEALQYDINDKSIIRSSFMGYFMSIIYMSLPYHKCFQRRNWWDIYHWTPKSRILFMANAANWYYKAYYDICRELWYSIGPLIGSNIDIDNVRKTLRNNLKFNLENKDIRVSYQNAYKHKDSISKKIDKVGSAVTYISSVFIYNNHAPEKNIVQEKLKVQKRVAPIQGSILPRAHSFVNNRDLIDKNMQATGNWMRNNQFLSSRNLDYSAVSVLSISILVQKTNHLYKDIEDENVRNGLIMFESLNKVIFNKYCDTVLKAYTSKLNPENDIPQKYVIGILKSLDKKFMEFATKAMLDQHDMALNPRSDRGQQTQQIQATNLLLVMQILYLKITGYKYNLNANEDDISYWNTHILNPCITAFNCTLVAYAEGLGYMRSIVGSSYESYNTIFCNESSKITKIEGDDAANEWNGWYCELSGGNQEIQIPGFIKDVIEAIHFHTNDYLSNDGKENNIFEYIKKYAKKHEVMNENLLSSYDSYIQALSEIHLSSEKKDYFTTLAYALVVSSMALICRIAYKFKSTFVISRMFSNDELASHLDLRTSQVDIKSIMIYSLPFFIFCANMISRIALKGSPIDKDLRNANNELKLKEICIDKVAGINISQTYSFIRSFISDDKYDSSKLNDEYDSSDSHVDPKLANMSVSFNNNSFQVLEKSKSMGI